MRMFLVAMCDVFLLLYLTAISQQESAPTSKITLQDYRKLEKLHKESSTNDKDLQERIISLSDEKLALLQKLESAEKKILETESKAEEKVTEKEKESLEALEKSKKAEEERLLALESQKKAEEEARLALEESKKAKDEAEAALSKEQLALAMAAREKLNAAEKEKMALLTAEKAILAQEKADVAESKAAVQEKKLTSVLQPMDKAFKENIETKLSAVKVYIRRDGIFGDREVSLGSVGAASEFDGYSVIFQSLAELKLDKRIEDLLEIKIDVDGIPIQGLFTHPTKPLVGLIIDTATNEAKVLDENADLMPTLVAVRNNPTVKFSDRIRDLDPKKFFIQRDKLVSTEKKGILAYKAEGFRGTGDYGEVIMAGDQIMDLDGNLLGIGIDRNLVSSIGSHGEWEMQDASGKSLLKIFSKK